jgi:hypothetical protein
MESCLLFFPTIITRTLTSRCHTKRTIVQDICMKKCGDIGYIRPCSDCNVYTTSGSAAVPIGAKEAGQLVSVLLTVSKIPQNTELLTNTVQICKARSDANFEVIETSTELMFGNQVTVTFKVLKQSDETTVSILALLVLCKLAMKQTHPPSPAGIVINFKDKHTKVPKVPKVPKVSKVSMVLNTFEENNIHFEEVVLVLPSHKRHMAIASKCKRLVPIRMKNIGTLYPYKRVHFVNVTARTKGLECIQPFPSSISQMPTPGILSVQVFNSLNEKVILKNGFVFGTANEVIIPLVLIEPLITPHECYGNSDPWPRLQATLWGDYKDRINQEFLTNPPPTSTSTVITWWL